MIIPKGCTVINTFTIPYTEDEIEVVYITYQQSCVTIIEKTLSDCTFVDGKMSVELSQEDTLLFDDNYAINIQIRIRLKNGMATKSNIIGAQTDKLLKKGVI